MQMMLCIEYHRILPNLTFQQFLNLCKMLNLIQKEDRKPLWESTPEEFGLTHEDLNRSHIEKDTDHAIREQAPTI